MANSKIGNPAQVVAGIATGLNPDRNADSGALLAHAAFCNRIGILCADTKRWNSARRLMLEETICR